MLLCVNQCACNGFLLEKPAQAVSAGQFGMELLHCSLSVVGNILLVVDYRMAFDSWED